MKIEAKVNEGFKTEIGCSNPFIIDQPKAAGGNNLGPNPLEVFLSSLGACVCAIGRIISNQKRLNVKMINVEVQGDIDKDFLLGKTKEGRAGFQEIRMNVEIDADMTAAEKEAFVGEIASRCPVADNIKLESVVKANII